jgi:hypothetical protein
MTTAPATPLISVMHDDRCLGFLYRRRGDFEAFTIDEVSVGTFSNERAIAAILNPARQTLPLDDEAVP